MHPSDLVRSAASALRRGIGRLHHAVFPGSSAYWIERYANGGDSGWGSYGRMAQFKATIVNAIVQETGASSVIEFGCGDGNQLQYARYPSYLGLDVSSVAIQRCRHRFSADPSKRFKLISEYAGERGALALSLDVLYHLVEDRQFEEYMARLFASSSKHVLIFSTNADADRPTGAHVRHRVFTRWVQSHAPAWTLVSRIPNWCHEVVAGPDAGPPAEFFWYELAGAA